jgi:hypothetical protein
MGKVTVHSCDLARWGAVRKTGKGKKVEYVISF